MAIRFVQRLLLTNSQICKTWKIANLSRDCCELVVICEANRSKDKLAFNERCRMIIRFSFTDCCSQQLTQPQLSHESKITYLSRDCCQLVVICEANRSKDKLAFHERSGETAQIQALKWDGKTDSFNLRNQSLCKFDKLPIWDGSNVSRLLSRESSEENGEMEW